jgi:hypothetical protein
VQEEEQEWRTNRNTSPEVQRKKKRSERDLWAAAKEKMSKTSKSQTRCSGRARAKLGPSFRKIGKLQFMSSRTSRQQQTAAAVSLLYTGLYRSVILAVGGLVS